MEIYLRRTGSVTCPQRRTMSAKAPAEAGGWIWRRSFPASQRTIYGDGPRPGAEGIWPASAASCAPVCKKRWPPPSLRLRYRDRSRSTNRTPPKIIQPRVQEFIKDPARVRADTDARDWYNRADCPTRPSRWVLCGELPVHRRRCPQDCRGSHAAGIPYIETVTASPLEPRRRARRLTPTEANISPPDGGSETRDLVP